MYIETERLILRDTLEQDAEGFFELINDENVKKYPFHKGEETIDFIRIMIKYFKSVRDKGLIIDDEYPERGLLTAVCLKESREFIGLTTFHPVELISEFHMGWFINSKYTRKGYASEAAKAAFDFYINALDISYISTAMRADNIASFKTAVKSGFTLIEKRIPFCNTDDNFNVCDYDKVKGYFSNIKNEIENGDYFYFQKRREA